MDKNKLNVLLTGASGTIGSEVLAQLADNSDVALTVFDVKTKKAEKIFKPFYSKVRFLYGDITNKADLDNAVKNQDVVIHLAGIIPPLADEKPDLAYKVNVLGMKNLVNALKENAKDAFLMFSSSVAVYGDRLTNPNIRVGDTVSASDYDEYAKNKIECEHIIQDSGIDWTIFRLAAIMKNHKISKLMFHMPLETTMEICTAEDTARAFSNGIWKRNELKNRIFNLGGGKQCTTSFGEFLQKSFDLFGLGKVNFAEHTFAKRNFHCGYFVDGDDLENIVHFRQDDLESYYAKTKKDISSLTKLLASIFRFPIKKYLQSQSEPLKAFKEGNKELIKRYFGETN